MSEYQYYEFVAVDRPLDDGELDELRALSTRAHITPTSFVNTYEWGSFRGDPQIMMERYFDGFLYLANWGTHEVMLRVPARLVDLGTAQRYCVGDTSSAWASGEHIVIRAVSEDEEGDAECDGEGVLASILPVRVALMSGDLRGLYLLWLACVQAGQVDGDTVEPPVPPGLGVLIGALTDLTDFLRIDPDLLDVAAVASGPDAHPVPDAGLAAWVGCLPAAERDALLLALLRGDDPHLRTETLRRARPSEDVGSGSRTVKELLDAASAQRLAREEAEHQARQLAAAERGRRAAAAREQRLVALAAEGERAWQRVGALVAATKAAEYDTAVALLTDLRAIWDGVEFNQRIGRLRAVHQRKPAFMQRLDRAGL